MALNISSLPIADHVEIACKKYDITVLPEGIILNRKLGIVCIKDLDGSIVYRAESTGLFEVRGVKTPTGDYLIMCPIGKHYAECNSLGNSMYAFRSSDKGKNWTGPTKVFDIDYNQHGFVPLIPRGTKRIYCFGTQPIWSEYLNNEKDRENAPIGYFFSDDDGYSWNGPTLIHPSNDSSFKGMSVTRMCETDRGTWLLGAHDADWSVKPLQTRQYILRSEDKGLSWKVLPGHRPDGWYVKKFGRMDEGRVLNLGNDKVLFMIRTPEGHLWMTKSFDDGLTWEDPYPTSIVQPDAPPMIERLSDGRIICLHHNRHHDTDYSGLSGLKEEIMRDRTEVWMSISEDEGDTWSSPRFLFSNACKSDLESPFRNHQCSYIDMFVDGDMVNLFVPHRWQEILHLKISIDTIDKLF